MDNILEELKKSIQEAAAGITLDNVKEVQEEINKYFKMAFFMVDLDKGNSNNKEDIEEPEVKPEVQPESKPEVQTEEPTVEFKSEEQKIEKPIKEDIDNLANVFDDEKKERGLRFVRKVSGGVLMKGSSAENIFVPESIVRRLGIEDGDKVSVDVHPASTTYKPLYYFNIVEKGDGTPNNEREEFKYGLVQYDKELNLYYVEENVNKETLRVNDVPMRHIISKKDEHDFGLQTGDFVDIAWYTGNFNKARVIWRYHLEDVEVKEKTQSKKMLAHNSHQIKAQKEEEIPQLLMGKTICLIGLEPYWDKYKRLVEERGGKLITVSSQTHKISRSASIRKSDIVVVGISHTSHEASMHANKKAKEYKTKFVALSGYGGTSFLSAIYKKLKVQEKVH